MTEREVVDWIMLYKQCAREPISVDARYKMRHIRKVLADAGVFWHIDAKGFVFEVRRTAAMQKELDTDE